MNTYKKGDSFERMVFANFKDIIDKDHFFVSKNICNVRLKPKYFSKDRNSEIAFDISIEARIPNILEPSLIIIIECKNYESLVPINDIEEFKSKIDQIGSSRVKGIICSANGYQKATLKYAQSIGIGLCRYNPSEGITWDLARSNANSNNLTLLEKNAIESLTNAGKMLGEGIFVGTTDFEYTYSLVDYLAFYLETKPIGSQEIMPGIEAPFISSSDIKESISKLYEQHSIRISHNQQVKYESLICALAKDIAINDNIDLGIDRFGNRYIGKYSKRQISTYDGKDYKNSRWNFTLAHEIGHYVLHDSILESCEHSDIDYEFSLHSASSNKYSNLEIQANKFAAEMLLPDDIIHRLMPIIIEREHLVDKGFGFIYLDNQRVNTETFHRVAEVIRQAICVSNLVIMYKLKSLGYLSTKHQSNKDLVMQALKNMMGLE